MTLPPVPAPLSSVESGGPGFRLDEHTPEFDAWKWAKLEDAPGLVIPFKAAVYSEVAKRFVRWAEPV